MRCPTLYYKHIIHHVHLPNTPWRWLSQHAAHWVTWLSSHLSYSPEIRKQCGRTVPLPSSGQSPFYLLWFSVVLTVPWPVAVPFKLESLPSRGFFLLVFRSMSLLLPLFRIPAIDFRDCPDSEPLLLWLRLTCPLWDTGTNDLQPLGAVVRVGW